MKKIFVGSLPPEATQDAVVALFSEYGTVRSIDFARDIFSGKCKGFAFIEMEGHEARAAIAALNRSMMGGNTLKVNLEQPRRRGRR